MTNAELLAVIARLLPYAESRAEDMTETAEETKVSGGTHADDEREAVAYAEAAWSAVEAARAALASA